MHITALVQEMVPAVSDLPPLPAWSPLVPHPPWLIADDMPSLVEDNSDDEDVIAAAVEL